MLPVQGTWVPSLVRELTSHMLLCCCEVASVVSNSVRTPQMAAHQAPPSLGFSRQEHWSGLPFPSPMHEWKVKVKSLSRVWLLAIPWTAAYQAPLSMEVARQEYWSGSPVPSPICFPAWPKLKIIFFQIKKLYNLLYLLDFVLCTL